MKRCEAGRWKEMNTTIAPTFTTCTTLSLQFCDNDVRVAETPDQRKRKSTPEISSYSEQNLDLLSHLFDM